MSPSTAARNPKPHRCWTSAQHGPGIRAQSPLPPAAVTGPGAVGAPGVAPPERGVNPPQAAASVAGKPARPEHFEVRPHAFGFKPGIDLDRVNQLADELEAEETARKLSP